MCSGPPAPSWEKDGGQRGGVQDSADLPRECAVCWAVIPGHTQDMGQRDLYTRQYCLYMETSPPLAVIAFSRRGSPGNSADSSWSGSGWGSSCQKGQSRSSWFWSGCLLPCRWLLKTPLKLRAAQCLLSTLICKFWNVWESVSSKVNLYRFILWIFQRTCGLM